MAVDNTLVGITRATLATQLRVALLKCYDIMTYCREVETPDNLALLDPLDEVYYSLEDGSNDFRAAREAIEEAKKIKASFEKLEKQIKAQKQFAEETYLEVERLRSEFHPANNLN